jgi:hypothetical protein
VNQLFPASLSEAAWGRGMREYSGIQARLEDAERHAAADSPHMVENHQVDVKSYSRASKISVMIELTFKGDLANLRKVDAHNTSNS